MRKFIIFICAFLIATVSPSEAKNASRPKILVKVGDTAIVSRFAWIECMNPEPLKPKYGRVLKMLDVCSVQAGGRVTVVAVDMKRNLDYAAPGAVLLEYAPPTDGRPDFNPCPAGTLYMTSTYRFSIMNKEWTAQAGNRATEKAREQKEREWVNKTLGTQK